MVQYFCIFAKRFFAAFALLTMLLCGSSIAQTPRYFDPELRLSAPDLSGLPRLRFLTSLDFPPFNFADANKKPTGVNVDIARAICDTLNIAAKCEIQAMPWRDLEKALEDRRGEAIIAGTAITAEKRAAYTLSHTYFRFPARFIAKRDLAIDGAGDFQSALAGKKVAVVKGSAHEAMLQIYFPKVVIDPLVDAQLVYDAVSKGDAELAFVDGVYSSFWLTSSSADKCCAFVGGPYYSERFLGKGMAIVTRREDEVLSQAMDAALKSIEESGKYLEIFERYFPNSPHGGGFSP